jgi:RNA polymerase sigma factor (sigma-70 family)
MTIDELKIKLSELHVNSFTWAKQCCYGNASDAGDVVQNSYLKILEGKAVFKEKSSLKTWVFGIIRFTALEFYKTKKRIVLIDNPIEYSTESDKNTDSSAFEADRKEIILQYIQKLSKQQQQVLQLVFYHSLNLEEAAKVMGISPGTASKHYARGKSNLKTSLSNAGIWQKLYQ